MTSAIQPVLGKVGLPGSNLDSTGEGVTNFSIRQIFYQC